MLDYIARYGETPMAELPFGAVDNLIFAELSYCDFSNAAAQMPGRLSALRAHLAGGVKQPDDELLNRLSTSARCGDVVAYHFVDHFDPVQTLQFAAVTLLLPDGTAYVSFRGTDSTLVGWKEDFNLAFATPVPAQLEAVRYLKQVADVLACPRVKDVIAAGGQPRRDTQYVAVNGRNGFIKGDGEYRACRIVADSGKLYQVAVRVGETAAVLVHHDAGGALQAAGAAVIAQALPQGEQAVFR